LLIDIAIHLASGRDWRGHRTKGRCGIIFFALERADLINRRLAAHRLRDNLPDLPIAVAGQVIDLMSRDCVNVILDAIRQAEQHFGCEVGLVIIDTYPKGIAAGGGDESTAKDQNIVLANLRRVLDRAHIHIAGIGHTGKDESKGERGSNARLADVDLLVHIGGDGIKTVTVKKANDQPEDMLTSFRLEPFDFGLDEDGDPFRTFILSEEIMTGAQADRSPLSNRQKLAIEALTEATLSHGRDAPAAYQLPHGIKTVPAEEWKTELYRRKIVDPDSKNPRARYSELRDALAAKKQIGVRDDLVWLAGRTL
jgi:AAA domain